MLPHARPGGRHLEFDIKNCGKPVTADEHSEIVLQNEWVRVHRRRPGPGCLLYPFSPLARSLAVFVRGGRVREVASGRTVWWRDGRVAWLDRVAASGEHWVNDGDDEMHLVIVDVLDQIAHPASQDPPPLHYPNVPGEDLLENDFLMVQRFLIPPGTWEGVHAHGERTLYVHIKGGQWAVRSHTEPEFVYPERSVDGEVDWMTPIPLAEGHESGNAGDEPIDLVWVSVK